MIPIAVGASATELRAPTTASIVVIAERERYSVTSHIDNHEFARIRRGTPTMTRSGAFFAVVLLLANSAIAQIPKTDRELAGLKGKCDR